MAQLASDHFGGVAALARHTLAATHALHRMLGTDHMLKLTNSMRTLSANLLPQWNPHIPQSKKNKPLHTKRFMNLYLTHSFLLTIYVEGAHRISISNLLQQPEKAQDGAAHLLIPYSNSKLTSSNNLEVVYFTCCANRVMGLSASEQAETKTLPEVIMTVLHKANYKVKGNGRSLLQCLPKGFQNINIGFNSS